MPCHSDRVRRHYDPNVDRVKNRLLGEEPNVKRDIGVHVERDASRNEYILTMRISQKALAVARDTPKLLIAAWDHFEHAIKDLYKGLYEGTPAKPQPTIAKDFQGYIDKMFGSLPNVSASVPYQPSQASQADWLKKAMQTKQDIKKSMKIDWETDPRKWYDLLTPDDIKSKGQP